MTCIVVLLHVSAASAQHRDRYADELSELEMEEGASTADLDRKRASQVLREAFELLEDEDWTAGLRALQKLVQRTGPEILDDLNATCARDRGMDLAHLIAHLRLREARERAGDEPIMLRFATRYEGAALGELLQKEYEQLLAERFDGRSVRGWADAPEEYVKLTRDSRPLVLTARRAAGLISSRLRVDFDLRRRPQERRALYELRSAVARLVARVSAMRGFHTSHRLPAEDDPAAQKLRELAEHSASQPASDKQREAAAETDEQTRKPPLPSDDFPDPSEGGRS